MTNLKCLVFDSGQSKNGQKFSREKWDNFVLNNDKGSIHQTTAWMDFQLTIKGRERVLIFAIINEQEEILAGTLCVQMKTGFGKTCWWYSPRGPVFNPLENWQAGKFLIEKVQEKLKTTTGIFWRTDPYFTKSENNFLCEKDEIFPGKLAIQQYQPTDTLMIDLRQTEQEILSDMKRKGRYNIKLAEKKGVQIKFYQGDEALEKLPDFWKLNQATTARDGFVGHEEIYYKNFITKLKSSAVLCLAEFEGRVLSVAISTFHGKKAIYYFGASTSDREDRKLMSPYLLQWEMIRFAQKRKCTTYDFLGISPENSTKHAYDGISEFKHKFGGYRQTYISATETALRPCWYWAYKLMKKLR